MLQQEIPRIIGDDPRISQMVEDIVRWDNYGEVERIDSFGMWIEKYQITQITARQFSNQWSGQSGKVAILFDDVIETLEQLKKKYKLAVLTNGNSGSQRRKLKTIALDEYWDYTLVSEEFGISKPDPAIFQYTAGQLNLPVEDCAYVGDNYRIDVLGSLNAGMMPVFVNRRNHPPVAQTTITEIRQLLDIF